MPKLPPDNTDLLRARSRSARARAPRICGGWNSIFLQQVLPSLVQIVCLEPSMGRSVFEVNGPARSIAEIGLAVDILAQANQVWLKRCDGHISGSSRLIDGLIVQMIQLVLDLRFFHSI